MSRAGAARIAWTVLALALLAFALFEVIKHAGWTISLALLGLIGPDLTFLVGLRTPTDHGQLAPRAVPYYNVAHHPLPPIVLMTAVALIADTNDQAAPLFTLGLVWLMHIAVDRACGFGPRTRDGYLRTRRRPRCCYVVGSSADVSAGSGSSAEAVPLLSGLTPGGT